MIASSVLRLRRFLGSRHASVALEYTVMLALILVVVLGVVL